MHRGIFELKIRILFLHLLLANWVSSPIEREEVKDTDFSRGVSFSCFKSFQPSFQEEKNLEQERAESFRASSFIEL